MSDAPKPKIPQRLDGPPQEVLDGMSRIFLDHEQLSDFIMYKKGIPMVLDEIREQARSGNGSPNAAPSIWMLRFIKAIRAEIDELEESIAWKWWRPDQSDLQNCRVEIVDAFHFLMTMAALSGMDGRDFARIYYEKRAINVQRQVVGFLDGDNANIGTKLGEGDNG